MRVVDEALCAGIVLNYDLPLEPGQRPSLNALDLSRPAEDLNQFEVGI